MYKKNHSWYKLQPCSVINSTCKYRYVNVHLYKKTIMVDTNYNHAVYADRYLLGCIYILTIYRPTDVMRCHFWCFGPSMHEMTKMMISSICIQIKTKKPINTKPSIKIKFELHHYISYVKIFKMRITYIRMLFFKCNFLIWNNYNKKNNIWIWL